MPWSIGANVSTGDVLTASRYNQDVLANLTMIGGAWTSYTPTWTNVTLGTGVVQQSAYMNAGKLYLVRIYLKLGTSGAFTGTPEFTLPDAVSMNSNYSIYGRIGTGTLIDDSAGAGYPIEFGPSTTTYARARFLYHSVSGANVVGSPPNATTPVTWTVNDVVAGTIVFEAA